MTRWKRPCTAKWIWDSFIFSSIKPKYDKQLFVYFCVFPQIYLSCTENCFILMFRTIFGATQVNSGENTKVNKQSLAMFWLNWIKYGSVSHSLSCRKVSLEMSTKCRFSHKGILSTMSTRGRWSKHINVVCEWLLGVTWTWPRKKTEQFWPYLLFYFDEKTNKNFSQSKVWCPGSFCDLSM